MGRELKRVPLDFDWPIDKTWKGFLNPYPYANQCEACNGKGYSPRASIFYHQWYGHSIQERFDPVKYGSRPVLTFDSEALRDAVTRKIEWSIELDRRDGKDPDKNWYLLCFEGAFRLDRSQRLKKAIKVECLRMFELWKYQWSHQLNQEDVEALVKEERLSDFTHTWNKEDGWQPKDPPVIPTAEQVNAWSMSGMGHDSINCSICVRARCEREGVEVYCPNCQGDGSIWQSEEAKQLYENWEPEEPPTGEGYQRTMDEIHPWSWLVSFRCWSTRWLIRDRCSGSYLGDGYESATEECNGVVSVV